MAKRPTITTVSSGFQSTTTLNTNLTNLRDGFDNTLSLDGSTPNAMSADLDMGSNDIINGGTAAFGSITVAGTDLATQVNNAAASAVSASASASAALVSEVSAAASVASTALYVDTVADLRNLTSSTTSDTVVVKGYHTAGDGGGGNFHSSGSVADDGIVHFVDASSRTWVRDWEQLGCLKPQDGGAIPDGTERGAALFSVFDYCGQNQIPLFVSSQGETSGGGTGRYLCDRALPIYTGSNHTGKGNIEIRFLSDTDGLYTIATGTTITSNFDLSGYTIVGNAPTSSASTQTVGLRLKRCRDFVIDLDVRDFVNLCDMDAESTGFNGGTLKGNWDQNFFPNATNSAPNIGLIIDSSGSKKVQNLNLDDLKIYSQGTASLTGATSGTVTSGVKAAVSLPSTGLPIYKGSGIVPYIVDTNGFKTLATGFTIYDNTVPASPVALASNWVNTAQDPIFDLAVDFAAGDVGSLYEIIYVDPFGVSAVFCSTGSAITIEGGEFGGYDELFDLACTDSIIKPAYTQIANTFVRTRATFVNSEVWSLEDNSSVLSRYLVDSGASFRSNPNVGRKVKARMTSAVYTGNVNQTIAGSNVVSQSQHPNVREISYNIDGLFNAPSNSSVTAIFSLYKKKNDGTATLLNTNKVSGLDTVWEENMFVTVYDDEVGNVVGGVSDKFEYYLQCKTARTTDTITINSTSTETSHIAITEKEPHL